MAIDEDSKVAPTLRTWLTHAPFSLALSSGFFGFFAHAGLVSALEKEGLKPQKLMGSSAGALVSGLLASGLNSQEIKSELLNLLKEDFWDPSFGLGLLKGERFEALLKNLLKCDSFEACPIPVQMSAFDCFRLKARLFTQGDLASAMRASCTFPGLFQPKWIEGRPFIDGGVTDRSGLLGVEDGERVFYHHLASRSWWRSKLGLTSIPRRDYQAVIQLKDLPRCGPNRLDLGAQAFDLAHEQTLRALDQVLLPLSQGHSQVLTDSWST
mgnify:CR=1 FL=1